jgi:adenylate cyclase
MTKMKRLFLALRAHAVRFGLSLLLVVLGLLHTSHVLPLPFIERLEHFSYDFRLNLLMPNTVDTRIVIVDIDEKSLAAEGRWPWGRDKLAQLVNTLFDHYKIRTLGFDVVFAEKDESSGLNKLELIQRQFFNGDAQFEKALQAVKPSLNYDQLFADSLKKHNVVLGYYFHTEGDVNTAGLLPTALFEAAEFEHQQIGANQATGYGANLALLQQQTQYAGHFNLDADNDGIARRVSMLIAYQGRYYDSLALAVLRAHLGNPPIRAVFAELGAGEHYAGLEALQVADRRIPVDNQVMSLVPYRGQQGSFQYLSATDVLKGKVANKQLADKIVLIGTSAPGLMDLRASPVQNVFAGVEVHANLISGMLDNNIKQHPAYLQGLDFLLMLIVGLLLALSLPTQSPLKATLTTLTVLLTVLSINVMSWKWLNLVMPISALLLMLVSIYLLNMSYGFFVESRAKREITGLFGQYVPPDLVSELAQNPQAVSTQGENRDMTVLFSDIRGFTSISESLSPAELTQIMNAYFTRMTHIIHENRGTIDKYIGDAIMAFWGAPLPDEQHVQHALNTAVQMQAAMQALNQSFAEKGWPPLQIGIGLNTGNMVVGNMGSNFRMAYTVMGDSVNLASRLESLTKYYGVDTIVSEWVAAKTPDMLYRELDTVRVKGKENAVTIFEPIGLKNSVSTHTIAQFDLYNKALENYRQQNWLVAEAQFKALQEMDVEYGQTRVIYALYLARMDYFKTTPPPPNWDGVFDASTK